MGILKFAGALHAKNIFRCVPSSLVDDQKDIPKGHFVVYVGEVNKKRFVIPISYLRHPLFKKLLIEAEEEYGFDHPMGGLTIPCRVETFVDITCSLSCS